MTILMNDDMSQPGALESYPNVRSFATAFENRDLGPTGELLNYVANKRDPGQVISRDQAVERAKSMNANELEGQIPKEGIGENVLNSMIQENTNDKKRADLAYRASSKVGSFFGSALGGMADPLGAAVSFIPFVGEARYTALLEEVAGEGAVGAASRAAAMHAIGEGGVNFAEGATQNAYKTALESAAGFGKTLEAKTLTGAAQGFLGSAALEPMNIALGDKLGKDYQYTQSLENLAFGTILGGGLHALTYGAAHGVGEVLRGFSDSQRADMMRAAVSNLIEDKTMNVDPIGQGYARLNQAADEAASNPELRGARRDDLLAYGNEKKMEVIQNGSEPNGTAFHAPEVVEQGDRELAGLPKGEQLEVEKQRAGDALNNFNDVAKAANIESNPEVESAKQQVAHTAQREDWLRQLVLCTQRGEG